MPWLEREGLRLHYETTGTGDRRLPVLLTHGFSASARMWEPNLPALAARRRVATWDMRGHGQSGSPLDPGLYSQDLALEDMATLLDVAGFERAALIGMSLGGYLSLAFRLRHPGRVGALILVDTGPGYRRDAERAEWNRWVERTAGDLERRGFAALSDSPEVACSRHRSADALALAARGVMAQHDASVIESLPRLDLPTLVVVGEHDAPFLRAADYMADRIPGARKLVIAGAGHAPNLDRPEEFNRAVLEFLEAV